jgi:hypothetical protein
LRISSNSHSPKVYSIENIMPKKVSNRDNSVFSLLTFFYNIL